MSFRIKLSFEIDDETGAEVLEGLARIMEIHERTRCLCGVPNYIDIISDLARGLQISERDWKVAYKPEFACDVMQAISNLATTEEIEDAQQTMVMFAAQYDSQVRLNHREKLFFEQYTKYGGIK